MNEMYFYLPARVCFGNGAIAENLPGIAELGEKPLIVTGRKSVFDSGLFSRITTILEQSRIAWEAFSEVPPEPEVDDVERGAEYCRRHKCDCVLAVGGGSAMDVGKSIAVLATNPGGLRSYFGESKFSSSPLPIVAVPTTSGTGSEVTRYAVIIDSQSQSKKTLAGDGVIPALAILDPSLLSSLPVKLTAATALDALTHGMESFISTRADYFSRLLSLESVRLLYRYLPQLNTRLETAASEKIREKLLLASLLAGMALNRTGTVVLHGMGYSLTLRYSLHHGTANGLLLPYVFDFLKENGYHDEIKILENIGGDMVDFRETLKFFDLPVRLSDIGVSAEDLESLSELCVANTKRSLTRMKITLHKEDFLEILRKAL